MVTLIENSWHIKKKGQEGLELGDIGSVMRHGVGGEQGGDNHLEASSSP